MTADKPSNFVPKLRFPEFHRAGDWKLDQIGNVASISKGKRVSKADLTKGGATPCIRYAELYTHYREVIHKVVSRTDLPHEDLMLSQAEDVIVPASGETKLDIARAACVLLDRVALGGDLNVLRSDLYGPFLSYLLNSPLRYIIAQMAQGDTVAHLYPKQLSQVWLAYPLRLEQQKIADCLGSLDHLIESVGRKIEALQQHKQGLMQRLFPRPNEALPRLRFPVFRDCGEWVIEALGVVCELYQPETLAASELTRGGPYLVYGANGVIGRHHRYNHKDSKVVVACRGACGEVNRTQPRSWITGNSMVVEPKSDLISEDFIFHLLKSNDLTSVVSGSAQPQITRTGFSPFLIRFPDSKDEQQKIVDCLGSLDVLIATQGQRLEALRQHKLGLMQQLFPSPEL